jgi:WD40 repeat protein
MGGRDGLADFHRADRGRYRCQSATAPGGFRGVVPGLLPDGRWLAAAGFGEGVQVWDLNAAEAAPRLFVGHTKGTWGIGFSPDSRRLASASADQTVRLWEVATGEPLAVLRGHGSEVWCVDFGAEGRSLVSGGKDRQVLNWPIADIRDVDRVEGATFSPLVFSGNSQRAATVSTNAYWSALVHEIASGRILRRFEQVRPLGLDHSGDTLWVRSQGFSVGELRVDTGQRVGQAELDHLESEIVPEHWAITPDGRWISGVAGDGWLSVWHRIPNAATAPRVFRQRLAESLPWSFVHLAPGGGDLVVTVGEAGFWAGSIASGALRPIRAHLDMGKGAAFSPNGRLLATASVDATLRLWAYPKLAEAGTLHGHPTEVSGVAFSPDGEILASSETGQGIRFWHVRTLREVAVLRLPDIVQDVVFSPDGQILAASLRRGHFQLLRAPRREPGGWSGNTLEFGAADIR